MISSNVSEYKHEHGAILYKKQANEFLYLYLNYKRGREELSLPLHSDMEARSCVLQAVKSEDVLLTSSCI